MEKSQVDLVWGLWYFNELYPALHSIYAKQPSRVMELKKISDCKCSFFLLDESSAPSFINQYILGAPSFWLFVADAPPCCEDLPSFGNWNQSLLVPPRSIEIYDETECFVKDSIILIVQIHPVSGLLDGFVGDGSVWFEEYERSLKSRARFHGLVNGLRDTSIQ